MEKLFLIFLRSSTSKISTVLCIVMHFPGLYKEDEARLQNRPYLLYRTASGKWAQRIRFPPQDTAHFMSKQDEGTVEIMLTKLLPEKFFSVPYLSDYCKTAVILIFYYMGTNTHVFSPSVAQSLWWSGCTDNSQSGSCSVVNEVSSSCLHISWFCNIIWILPPWETLFRTGLNWHESWLDNTQRPYILLHVSPISNILRL